METELIRFLIYYYQDSINRLKCETIIKIEKKTFLYMPFFAIMKASATSADIFKLPNITYNITSAEVGIEA